MKSTDGRTVYVLSLEHGVFYAKDRDVEGLELILRHPYDKADAQNLLASIKNWHGAQPFLFDAEDLKDGARGSVYGERRTISIDILGLLVYIVVLETKVSRNAVSPPPGYQLDSLDLKIEVDNATGKSRQLTASLPSTQN
jgi:hypothetical protein